MTFEHDRSESSPLRREGGGPPRPARARWITVTVIVFTLGLALGAALSVTTDSGGVVPGRKAPAIQASDVRTGDTVRLADFRGYVVLLNVWATWCKPCELEMPSMQRLHEALSSQGLRIVAVSIDRSSSKKVLDWVQQRGLTFTVLHDPAGRIERVYQTTGVPESFIIDSRGVIAKREIGAREWDTPVQLRLFRQLLQASMTDRHDDPAESGTLP
jgi:peroxiredoxin